MVRTNDTSDDTFKKMMEWGQEVGKTCISCKDTPGFVVNRLLVPMLAEAIRMLERGMSQLANQHFPAFIVTKYFLFIFYT